MPYRPQLWSSRFTSPDRMPPDRSHRPWRCDLSGDAIFIARHLRTPKRCPVGASPSPDIRRAAGQNVPRIVAGFARIQCVLNSGESSYGIFHSAARLTTNIKSHCRYQKTLAATVPCLNSRLARAFRRWFPINQLLRFDREP